MGSYAAIRVAIAHDHAVFRTALRRLLAGTEDIRVVAEFGDAKALLSGGNCLSLDVLILDINMPGSDPIEIVAVKAKLPYAKDDSF